MNSLQPSPNETSSYFSVRISMTSNNSFPLSLRYYPGASNAIVLGEEGDAVMSFNIKQISGTGCSGKHEDG